jgi:acetyltransferase-like isoleucine patch superfamily enzyme
VRLPEISDRQSPPRQQLASVPATVRSAPSPLQGGPLAFLRFARANGMFTRGYLILFLRWMWLKLRWRGRLQTDGLCFIGPGVTFEIGRNARVHLGRWSWIGHGCKVRVHEGELHVGAKTVFGQECTISAFQHISIGRECIVADRVMMIDFDHGMVEVERPIREQGIYKRNVRIGHNCWIGYGACILRGVTVGDNAVIGTSSVVTADIPANGVVGGIPAKLIRMREAPRTFRWGTNRPGGDSF